jgi:glutamine amidotransferase
MSKITSLAMEDGNKLPFRFTAALANGRDLYAFRYAFNDKANTLYYRASANSVIVVSEPLDKQPASWKAVPENHVIVAQAGKPVEVLPFMQRRQVAAE